MPTRNADEVAEFTRGNAVGQQTATFMVDTFATMTPEDFTAMVRGIHGTRDTPFYEGFKAGFSGVMGSRVPEAAASAAWHRQFADTSFES